MFAIVVTMGFLSQEASLFPFCLGLALCLLPYVCSVSLSLQWGSWVRLGIIN